MQHARTKGNPASIWVGNYLLGCWRWSDAFPCYCFFGPLSEYNHYFTVSSWIFQCAFAFWQIVVWSKWDYNKYFKNPKQTKLIPAGDESSDSKSPSRHNKLPLRRYGGDCISESDVCQTFLALNHTYCKRQTTKRFSVIWFHTQNVFLQMSWPFIKSHLCIFTTHKQLGNLSHHTIKLKSDRSITHTESVCCCKLFRVRPAYNKK